MATLREVFRFIGGGLKDALVYMGDHILNDPAYREGFFACILFLLLTVGASQSIGWAWSKVLKFFSATAAPPKPSAGPTPVSITTGCGWGVVVLVGAVLAVVGLVWGLVGG